ncbi:MAG: type III polyketide synthase [Balneolaceae bacterium]
MPSTIHYIETATPEFSHQQEDLRERMKEVVSETDRDRKLIHLIYSKSGIKTRHSVINDFHIAGSHSLFFNGSGSFPGTASRNDTYIREGRKLFVEVAKKLIQNSDFNPPDITHLITVSCTGFYAPGPDFDIIRALGLSSSVERYHLGFMGCYAVIPALKMADQICKSNPKANVMIVSVELCTLHFQANPKMDNILSASVFADGGSGAIVSSRNPTKPSFKINTFVSDILENGSKDMAWSIGDTGFEMILSNYIPDLLSEGLDSFMKTFSDRFSINLDDITHWAIHPGGRAILDKAEQTLGLPKSALKSSRKVLSDYGNMSSATILFVLKELVLNTEKPASGRTLAMAFGPGLTLETVYLTLV